MKTIDELQAEFKKARQEYFEYKKTQLPDRSNITGTLNSATAEISTKNFMIICDIVFLKMVLDRLVPEINYKTTLIKVRKAIREELGIKTDKPTIDKWLKTCYNF